MAVKLNKDAFEFAKKLINEGKFTRGHSWEEFQPTTEEQDNFIQKHGLSQYGNWFLGVNTEKNSDDKGYYEFPYGNFNVVSRRGAIAAEQRAGQYHHYDIEKAAKELKNLIDAKSEEK